MCDKKNSVLFTETECLVLSPDFKLLDESQVLLKVPRHDNMYSFDLKNVVPSGGLTCLFAKATIDESNLWHKRLGHINFKTINKLVRGNLVGGLPLKLFENDHTCVACWKGKQHKASCKTKLVSSISQPLQMLHMDIFGPTFVRSISHKTCCLIVTNDFSRFIWVFFLATKDETSRILKTFIIGIENHMNHKVKIIICDNGTEFKNNDMNQFCGIKGIKREFSVARTPQQNRVAERKNRTLIGAARTMLAYSLLPTTFWAEAVNTACYVQNRVLVTKPHNKTLYELLHGRPPSISFMRPFGCHVTILNTLDLLGKFDRKADEGFLVGYSINSKAFRVFNTRTRKVEENLHITFLENKPNVTGSGPDWLFDIDLLTNSMNYEPVTAGNQTNRNAEDAVADDASKKITEEPANEAELDKLLVQQKEGYANNTNRVSTVSLFVSVTGQSFVNNLLIDPLMSDLDDTTDLLNTGIFSGAYDDEDVGAEADLNNLETTMNVSPIPTTRIHKDHPKEQIIGDPLSAPQTRRMTKPKKVTQALTDPSWIEAMQDELLQFRLQKVWRLVDLPKGKHAIGTKWVYRNKKYERGIVVRNKARLVAQDPQFPDKVYKVEKALYGLHQAPRAWYETLSTYLLENRFRRGTIDKTLFNKKNKGEILLVQVYVDDIIFRSTKKYLCVEFKKMMQKRFQISSMGELTFFLGLQVKQKYDGIFINQDKYVADILKKFNFVTVNTISTLIETNKALLKDEEVEDVDVHLYRLMIGSLMYLTASRPEIIYVVCAYARDSPFDLEAFFDSDYARASLDRKSTIGGCQFLGKRLISWQCKKQTIVANSTTEAEYVATTNCCGHVLWIQNQMLDYGFNFMNTKIYIDTESTIYIVKNLVFHSKTKHIEIRHHFIIDSYEKRLIQVIKIHTYHNVADLLIKAFDVSSDEFGVKTSSCKVTTARQDLVLLDNMETYLERAYGNADFYEIVDFLTTSPTLTQIHVTVDGKTVVISESSVRSDLHFNDEDGITCLTNETIFENFALLGKRKRFFRKNSPLFASMLAPPVVEGEGSGQPTEPKPAPSTTQPIIEEQIPTSVHIPNVADEAVFKEWDDRVVRDTTTAVSLDAAQASGVNTPRSDEERLEQHELTDNVPLTPHDSPLLGGHTPGSDEGRLQQEKLTDIVTTLSQKVEGLESDLKKTKKLRILTLVTSEDEEDLVAEGPSKQGRSLIEEMDLDAGISLVSPHVEVQGSTASPQRNANTIVDDLTLVKTLMEIRKSAAKDKGKAKMYETESPRKMKQRKRDQISRDEEVAQKLQEEFDAGERQRMAQVHQTAQGFIDAEWDDVLARVAADEDFVQQLQAAKRNKPMTPGQQKDYMSNYIKNQEGGYSIKQLKSLSFEQVKNIFETTMRRVQSFVPMGSELEVQRLKRVGQEVLEKPVKRQKIGEALVEELVIQPLQVRYPIIDREVYYEDTRRYWRIIRERFSTTEPTDDKEKELWIELKRLFEPDNDDILWKLQRCMHDPLVWRLYDTYSVHHVSSVKGHDIFMLVEKEYPLTRGTLGLIMMARLLVEADKDLIQKLDDLKVNHKFRGGLLGIRGFYNLMTVVQVCAAA
ncbi:putative ribonuclease H-like domain-containing protein [Tanacetum coccineum]